MGRCRWADRDGAGWRTRKRRRFYDLLFLGRVRRCKTLDQVTALRRRQRKPLPEWRHVALMRAIKRVCLNGEK